MDVTKPLDQMPLYVKSNSLLPLAEPVTHIGTNTVFKLHVRVYGDSPRNFTLYEDDGVSFDFEKGAQSRLVLSWASGNGSAVRTGSFALPRYEILDWQAIR